MWVAYCLDLSLAAQADSFEAAKSKLEEQLTELVEDLDGQDSQHAHYLLKRRAPLSVWLRYAKALATLRLSTLFAGRVPAKARKFQGTLPRHFAAC